jgi:hypothetical protein
MLPGIARALAGVVQLVSGFIKILSGNFQFFVDLVTGHFDKLGGDLRTIWDGIVTMFTGAWNLIVGVFQAGIGVIIGFVQGFIDGIVGFFTGLYETLVGHSIVPDMVNGIVNWIGQLPGRAMTFIHSLVDQITSTLGNLGSQALGWAQDMISQFVSGIQNGISQVAGAVGQIASTIASHLHFSLPEEGPLAHADTWMPDFGTMLTEGLNAQAVKVASLKIATSISSASIPATSQQLTAPGATTETANNTQIVLLLGQILAALQQQQRGLLNNNLTLNNNTISAPAINPQQLYSQIQALGGFGYQDLIRGAYGL